MQGCQDYLPPLKVIIIIINDVNKLSVLCLAIILFIYFLEGGWQFAFLSSLKKIKTISDETLVIEKVILFYTNYIVFLLLLSF